MKTRHGLTLGLAAFLALASACTKSDGDGVASANGGVQASANPSAPSTNPAELVLQLVACLRAEGVQVADPEPGDVTGKSALQFEASNAGDKQKIGAALEKCQQYMPGGGEPERLSPEELAQAQQFAQCMRDNGVPDMPDPNEFGRFDPGSNPNLSKDNPAMRAAVEKCQQGVPKK